MFGTFRRPGPWIAVALGSLGVVTGISFVRAQNLGPPANVTFRPGGGVPVRGVPMAQRPQGISFNSQVGLVGPIPRAVPVNPATPTVSRGFGQVPGVPNAPNFFGFGGQNPNMQGQQGGALGQGGGQQGGIGGQQGGTGGQQGIAGNIGGTAGNVGAGGNMGMQALGQNFQNPTGTAGFPQAPVGYFGGFTGGGITGSGIAGNSGNLGVGISGAQGGNTGISGGVGGFGAQGFGGGVKGVVGAGNNGI